MKLRFGIIYLSIAALLGGCSVLPTEPIPLSGEAVGADAGQVGVVMGEIPEVDTFLPGADCLLCIAVASGANSELTDHANTLPPEGVSDLKHRVAELLRKQGTEVVVIEETFNLDDLPGFSGPSKLYAKKDFRVFKNKYGVEKLLVIDIAGLGFKRSYAAYVPTSDPKGWISGAGYIVDLKHNKFEWYLPVEVEKSAEGAWDEPPKFPGLTNAYFQALERGKDAFLEPFRAEPPSVAGQPIAADQVSSN